MIDPISSAFRLRREDVSAERLDGDVIAVNLLTGAYFSLSGTAADVWTAATSGAAASSWLALLDASYSRSVPREEVRGLLAHCLEHGLIEAIEPIVDQASPLPDDLDRSHWSEPVLEVFTDLQDLILVDPIHDASDLGWPHIRQVDG